MSPRLAGGGPRIGFGEPFGEALRRPLAAETIREGEGGERLDVRRGGREAPPRRPQLTAACKCTRHVSSSQHSQQPMPAVRFDGDFWFNARA